MSLKIENASKGFDEILFEELDFEVQKGEIVALLGNSGCGKSTLLRIICGLEKLDVATGDSIDFEDVLMVGEGAKVKIGTPNVKGGKVTAEVMAHGRGEKVKIIKFRRRKHSRTQQGHRQSKAGEHRQHKHRPFRRQPRPETLTADSGEIGHSNTPSSCCKRCRRRSRPMAPRAAN